MKRTEIYEAHEESLRQEGRKEVVEWIHSHRSRSGKLWVYLSKKGQAKLKEWGIDLYNG